MKIKEQYINALQQCYINFVNNSKDIEKYELLIKETFEDMQKITEENKNLINQISNKDQHSEEDANKLESILYELQSKIEKLKKELTPFINNSDKIKNEIDTVYKKIISEYNYPEEDIIEYIKQQINI